MPKSLLPIAVYHEHPDWFRPLFQELERRDWPVVRLNAASHWFDPRETRPNLSLFFNRMSPSAYLRQASQGIFFTQYYLAHLERLGVPVINGRTAYAIETSKALQLDLLTRLGLPYPRSRVINHPEQALNAATGFRYPIVVKANIGGSGAGIVRYDSESHLQEAIAQGAVKLGIDQTALVQEYIPAAGGHITRVEVLGGNYLYAIKVFTTGDTFNLCPADICERSDGKQLVRGACPVDAPKTGIKVEVTQPPAEIIEQSEQIMRAAKIDVGGIEYIVDARDGQTYFYDINALSNFVADAVNVVGFDPHVKLVDFLETKAVAARVNPAASGSGLVL